MAKNNNLLDAKKAIEEIEAAWAAHYQALKPNADLLVKISDSYGKIKLPSEYLNTLKQVDANTKAVTESTEKLGKTQQRVSQLTSEQVVNTAALRKNADLAAKSTSALVGAYANLSASMAIAEKRYLDIIARGKTATQTQREYNKELKNAERDFKALQKQVLSADAAVGRWNRTGERSVRFARDLVGAFGIVGGVSLFASITRSIYDTTKETQSLDLALRKVTGTQEKFVESQQFLSRISEAYGQDIQALTKQYTQFYVSANDKLSGKQIEDIFESVAKAAGVMGLSTQSSERAFLALNQMLSKGTIQAEEIKGQLGEALPGAFKILAKSMGVTEKQLGNMLKAGEVLAAEVLPNFARELEKAYGIEAVKRVETLAAEQERLKNGWVELVRTLNENETGGLTQFFSFFIARANDAIQVLAQLNKSFRDLRNEAAGSSKASLSSFYETLPDENARRKTAEIDRKNALEWIDTYNEQLAKANHEYELFNKISLLNFSPERQKMLRQAIADRDRLNEALGIQRGRLQAANEELNKNNKVVKKSTELTKEQLAALKKAQAEAARLLEERLKNQAAREISDLERAKFLFEQRLENEAQYIDDKIALSQDIADKEIAIATRVFIENIRLHEKSLDLQAIDANNFRTKQEKAEQDHLKRVNELRKEAFDDFLDYREKYGRPAGDEFGTDVTYIPTDEYDKMLNAWKDFKKEQVKADDEATEELKKNIKDYLSSFTESFFGDAGLSSLFDIMDGKVKGFGEDWKVTTVAIMEATQEMFNFINKLSAENFDLERERVDKQFESRKAAAQGNEDAIKELEKERERRQREIRIREAKANKELAKVNIVINAAQGIVGAFKDGNVIKGAIFAALIAGIAAAQIAQVNSANIPEYWKGTDNAKSGLAWTQEKGREIITDRHGRIKSLGSDGGAQLTKLAAGDKVYNADRTQEMFDRDLNRMLFERSISPAPKHPTAQPNMDVDRLANRIDQAISRIPQIQMTPNTDAASSFVRLVVNGHKSHNSRKYQTPIKRSR